MKALFISYELPPIGGGGGRAAWQIARRLTGRGHEVRILTSLFKGLKEYEALEGVGIHRIRVRRKRADACPPIELLSFMWRSAREAKRLVKDFTPDVVCAFFAVPGGPAARRLWRAHRIPYVLSLRGSDVPRRELSRYQRLHLLTRPFIRRYCRDAAALVAVSGALRDAARQLAPGLSIEVIPNGVDTTFFRPASEEAGPTETPLLVFVGRLRQFKGVHHVLYALPDIEKRLGRPVRFTIVGDGPQMERLSDLAKEIIRSGAGAAVRFTGWLDPDAVRAIYASASLLVLPSLVEGHPNVMLEAMAMGVPCVASDVPGIREVVENGRQGLLVPPEDAAAIARAVSDILSDCDRHREMSIAARARAEEFSWDVVAERYEAVLVRAAGTGNARDDDSGPDERQ